MDGGAVRRAADRRAAGGGATRGAALLERGPSHDVAELIPIEPAERSLWTPILVGAGVGAVYGLAVATGTVRFQDGCIGCEAAFVIVPAMGALAGGLVFGTAAWLDQRFAGGSAGGDPEDS